MSEEQWQPLSPEYAEFVRTQRAIAANLLRPQPVIQIARERDLYLKELEILKREREFAVSQDATISPNGGISYDYENALPVELRNAIAETLNPHFPYG